MIRQFDEILENAGTSNVGAWIDGQSYTNGSYFSLIDPASATPLAEVADCGPTEAQQALDSSLVAFSDWRRTSAYERAAILDKFYELIIAERETLAYLISREMGKPIRESRGEVQYAAGFVKWYAEETRRLYGTIIPSADRSKRLSVIINPVGPVYAITPWNFPAAMVTRKVAPALGAGCTVLLKPAEQSPLTALALGELLHEAGLPPGVLQVLPTNDPGPLTDILLSDPRVRKLTFTGSTQTGAMLYTKAAATIKRVSLELGGHAPVLVFDDADLDLAVQQAVACKFRNAGQTCVSANRLYVHTNILDSFLERFVQSVKALNVGSPINEATDVGPLVNSDSFEKVTAHVDDARKKGGRVLAGGRPPAAEGTQTGYFFEPTVIMNADSSMRLAHEETFGPVAPVFEFRTEEEAIRMANDTEAGLAAYLFTRDVSRTIRVSEALEYGIVGVNDGIPSTPQAPFGGVKSSGIGREGGREGIEEYIERKFVSLGI